MSEQTKIEWATCTFNPWTGCRRVSPGCAHCYMFAFLKRFGRDATERRRTSVETWRNPLKWQRNLEFRCPKCKSIQPYRNVCETLDCLTLGQELEVVRQRVFPSMCDWLDDEVPIEWRADFLKLIHDTPNLDWLLLTKRPENWRSRLGLANDSMEPGSVVRKWLTHWIGSKALGLPSTPPPNVWVGTSVEDQQRADERIPELLQIPAMLRFLSVEPLLGCVDLRAPFDGPQAFPIAMGIQWIIVGGESGPGARPCNVEWIRSIVQQCKAAGVPCFVKQLGSWAYTDKASDAMEFDDRYDDVERRYRYQWKHPKGGDPSEWPEDLRVREFPTIKKECEG